jgi:hypothetical protein
MSSKTTGLIVAIVGLVVGLFFALAGVIGVGDPAFGPYQIAGTAIGVVVLIAGIVIYRRQGQA